MNTVYCSQCNKEQPYTAHCCAICGKTITTPGSNNERDANVVAFNEASIGDPEPTLPLADPLLIAQYAHEETTLANLPPLAAEQSSSSISESQTSAGRRGVPTTPLLYDQWQPGSFYPDGDQTDDNDPLRDLTWHKVVEKRSQHPPAIYPPRPTQQFFGRLLRHPQIFFWMSLVVVIILLLGGAFGILTSLGRGHTSDNNDIGLQVTPGNVVAGATVTLHGTHFTAHGRIGLSRDTSIPIVDTGDQVIIEADASGNFTDTAIVGDDWGNGLHTINAEDAHTHTIASFSILLLGQSATLRPAHLNLSQSTLDLGTSDSAMNSARVITLTNSGGGQLSWQSQSSQPWLQLSPQNGQVTHGITSQITIAANRANMQPGVYKGQLLFTSETGNIPLDVQMQVTPLNVVNTAVLQLSSAVLSFMASDGESSLAPQPITISNPGMLPLYWTATTDVPWLAVGPGSGTVRQNSSTQAGVSINTTMLLPGTYRGTITFNAHGNTVQNSPQNVYISITILPRCALRLSPSMLTFASAYQQNAPATKSISIVGTRECSASLHWNVSSNASWLTVNGNKGNTPSVLSVGVNVTGMRPGTYTSSITFSSVAGTQTLPVTFALAPPSTPILSTTATALSFNMIAGSRPSGTQPITITNSGGSLLNWQASPTTEVGSSWLNVSPTSGSLPAGQSATIKVNSMLPNGLTAGTYSGAINITGTDDAGHTAAGSPQAIPAQFIVYKSCGISATPALNYSSGVGQSAPSAQSITIKAEGACQHTLAWSTQVSTTSGGSWLAIDPATDKVNLDQGTSASVSATPAGLAAGTYQGSITISATDSITHATVGEPQKIAVTFSILPACALQTASTTSISFGAEAAGSPTTHTLIIGVSGSCNGNAMLQATANTTGSGWLSVSPATASVPVGGKATFTIYANPGTLAAGYYSSNITIAGTNGNAALASSPRQVNVSLAVSAPPALTATPNSLTFNVSNGQKTIQPITLKNTGGMPMDWTAALVSGAPSFVSLTQSAGTGLGAGGSATVNLNINAAGIASGQNFTTSVVISAIDPATSKAVAGSPTSIPVVINLIGPSMQISNNVLSFSTQQGSNPSDQSITLSNTGSGTLTWTAEQPSQSWLVVKPGGGSTAGGSSSNVIFSANAVGLTPGSYNATVTIMPAEGAAITLQINLQVTAAATPVPTPVPTPTLP